MSTLPFQQQPGNATLAGKVIAKLTTAPVSLKVNLTAVIDPTINDDSSGGYAIGSEWCNTSTNTYFLAANVSVGAAVWRQISGSVAPPDRSVTPVKTSLDFGGFFRNKTVNGDFNVANGGTSFSTPSNGSTTLDQWLVSYDGAIGTFSVSQQPHTIGQTDVPDEPEFFLRWNQTVAGSGSTFRRIEQRYQPVRSLAAKTGTVTLYMKADSARNVVGTLVQNFGSGGSGDVSIALGTFGLTTSFQKFTVNVSIPSISGKTIGSGNYLGLRLSLPVNATMVIDLSHVQVEENGQTVFEQRPFALEDFLCIGLVGTVSSVDATQGVEVVAGTPITSTGTIRGSQLVNSQTGVNYTYLTGDRGKLVTHNNVAAIAGTLPQAGGTFPVGWFMDVQNTGAGTLTITPTVSTIDGASTLVFITGEGARIFSDGTNYFTMRGGAGLSAPVFTKSFTSTAQAITFAGPLTIAHGLGTTPTLVQARLKCISTEGNYSVNDEFVTALGGLDQDHSNGISCVVDGTNLNIRFGQNLDYIDKTTGAGNPLTVAKWNIIFRAWA